MRTTIRPTLGVVLDRRGDRDAAARRKTRNADQLGIDAHSLARRRMTRIAWRPSSSAQNCASSVSFVPTGGSWIGERTHETLEEGGHLRIAVLHAGDAVLEDKRGQAKPGRPAFHVIALVVDHQEVKRSAGRDDNRRRWPCLWAGRELRLGSRPHDPARSVTPLPCSHRLRLEIAHVVFGPRFAIFAEFPDDHACLKRIM